jgi:hypothetical protein
MKYTEKSQNELHVIKALAGREGWSMNICAGSEYIAHVDKNTREAKIVTGYESFYLEPEEYEILSNAEVKR